MALKTKIKYIKLKPTERVLFNKHYVRENGNYELYSGISGMLARNFNVSVFFKTNK